MMKMKVYLMVSGIAPYIIYYTVNSRRKVIWSVKRHFISFGPTFIVFLSISMINGANVSLLIVVPGTRTLESRTVRAERGEARSENQLGTDRGSYPPSRARAQTVSSNVGMASVGTPDQRSSGEPVEMANLIMKL